MAFIAPTPIIRLASRPNVSTRRPTMCTDAPAKSAIPLNPDSRYKPKDTFTADAIQKTAICRCWQSGKFPLCDGSHAGFNKDTGSNVGPLVVSAPSN